MAEHKHAEVLRAIADGAPLSEFEVTSETRMRNAGARPLSDWIGMVVVYANDYEIRRKPKHIIVNGFKVPKPLDFDPPEGFIYYLVSPENECFQESCDWGSRLEDVRWLERGLIHSTPEAAAAHAKAMLGIDPEA